MPKKMDRAEEAVRLVRSSERQLLEIDELESSLELISTIIEELQNNRLVDPLKLTYLELDSLSGVALRLRLQSLYHLKQRRLNELKASLRTNMDIIRNISICPYCNGSGESLTSKYERFEGIIHKTVKTNICEYCNGEGVLQLGNEVTRMLKSINERFMNVSNDSTKV